MERKVRKGFGGRPRKHEPEAGDRVHLGIRVTPQMKRRLEELAAASGRSQSQEAEFRLARSFDREELLPEVLTLAYGPKLAGFLMMVGLAMTRAGEFTRLDSGAAPDGILSWTDKAAPKGAVSWTDNAAAFGDFTDAVLGLQEMYKEAEKRFSMKQHTPAGPADSRPTTSSGRWTQAPRASTTGEFKLRKARIARRKAQKP